MDLLALLKEKGKACSGCSACFNACPVNAIEMRFNAIGFAYPELNADKCINCGQCAKACPKLNPLHDNAERPECYAVRAADEIRFKSSSGGVFTLLAEWVFAQGGAVCGAVMEADYTIHHICTTDATDLARLQKSKYAQSAMGNTYQEAAEHLKAGKVVFFTGTPCQVAAMRTFAQSKKLDTTNLYCMDILCHGVPSNQMWKDYVRESFDRDHVKTVEFRSKLNGWRADQLRVFWDDTSSQPIPWAESAYLEGFLRNITLREGCGSCEFCGWQRQGDITAGDFWRVHEVDAALDDKKGTSVVLVNNAKGQLLFEKIKEHCRDFRPTPIEAAAKYNRMMTEYGLHHGYNRFRTLYPGHTFTDAVMQCRHALYDIGLVGPYSYRNYGSQLTYYALYQALTDMGYSVLMIERPQDCQLPSVPTGLKMFEQNPYPAYALSRKFANIAEMKFLNQQCEAFILGSDQILNHNAYTMYGKYVAMNFVTDNHRKIAYAASWGHDRIWGPESDRAEESYYLQRFDAFSVREKGGVELAKREFGVDATWVLDPVFICDVKKFEAMTEIAKPKLPIADPYFLTYFLNMPKGAENHLNRYADQHGLKILTLLGKAPREAFANFSANWTILDKATIEAWLALIRESKFFVCDSFHGVCFALIFKRQFLVMIDKNSGESRLRSILGFLGLEDRMVYSAEQLEEKMALPPIDYERITPRLKAEAQRSAEWLRDAIETDKDVRKPFTPLNILDGRCDELARQNAELRDQLAKLSQRVDQMSTAASNEHMKETLGTLFESISELFQQTLSKIAP